MKPVLVDTDLLIDFLRGKEKARGFLRSQQESGPIHCSTITVAEIFAEVRPHEMEKTRNLLDNLEIIPVTRAIAEKAGLYKGGTKCHSLELDDCLIAATAHIHRATLATGNLRHCPMEDIDKIAVACD